MLERTLELAEENNRMLRKMERAARWSLVIRIVYWTVVIGAAIGLFYYIQPYIEGLMAVYTGVNDFLR